MSQPSKRRVRLSLDGREVEAPEGATVLEVADAQGIRLPRLCHLPGLSSHGGCRLCLVEIGGTPRLQPACMLRAQEDMQVTTNSVRLGRYRRMIIELLFAERNHVCAVCVANGRCELQDLAAKLGMDHVRYPYRSPEYRLDASHARFALDPNRCILCTRCVRVCSEVEGAQTWGVKGRGANSEVIVDMDEPWGVSVSCTSCGKCVQVCPTGALFEKGRAVSESYRQPDFAAQLAQLRVIRHD